MSSIFLAPIDADKEPIIHVITYGEMMQKTSIMHDLLLDSKGNTIENICSIAHQLIAERNW